MVPRNNQMRLNFIVTYICNYKMHDIYNEFNSNAAGDFYIKNGKSVAFFNYFIRFRRLETL